MSDRRFEGEIQHWCERGNASYGFILFSHGGPQLDRVFFSHDDVLPDALGRCSNAKIIGSPVRFKLTRYLYKGEPSAKAAEVQSIFSADVENVQDHREVSVVEHILKSSRQAVASVFLKRRSGDRLYLCVAGVADDHKAKFPMLREGDHVWHGVAPPLGSQRTWRAVLAEFYSRSEEDELPRQTEAKNVQTDHRHRCRGIS